MRYKDILIQPTQMEDIIDTLEFAELKAGFNTKEYMQAHNAIVTMKRIKDVYDNADKAALDNIMRLLIQLDELYGDIYMEEWYE